MKDQAGRDLASFDYNTYNFLQFRAPPSAAAASATSASSSAAAATAASHLMDEPTFNALDLTYTTALSDGKTRVELIPNGKNIRVKYEDRWQVPVHSCVCSL
jgi:hypothetical protein